MKNKIYLYSHFLSGFILCSYISQMLDKVFISLADISSFSEKAIYLKKPADSIFSVISSILILPLFYWYYPVYRYVEKNDQSYKKKAEARFGNFYQGFIWFYLLSFLLELLSSASIMKYQTLNEYFFLLILPLFITLSYSAYVYYHYIDYTVYSRVIGFFTEENGRTGKTFSLSLRNKIYLFGVFGIIFPVIFISYYVIKINSQNTSFSDIFSYYIIPGFLFIAIFLEFLCRRISTPLEKLKMHMEKVAGGDFSAQIPSGYQDEIGQIENHFNLMTKQLAEREQLKDTFGKYMSLEIARKLMESGGLELGGDDIEAAVLFSDIRNFTSMSEKMTAKEVVELLNSYFSFITQPIMDNNGVINKFIGDAVMAFYTSRFNSADPVNDAVLSVIGMCRSLDDFNLTRKPEEKISFGIGLHFGNLVAGNIGSEKRLEYTVIGDTVNIASRIESENKTFNSHILVSESIFTRIRPELLDNFDFLKHPEITVKGKSQPVTLYQLTLRKAQSVIG